MIRFCVLGSGSGGNAILIRSRSKKILIDGGFSYAQLVRRAGEAGESLDGLEAIFVTHEHSDHVGGIGVCSRKLGIPVYMTPGTFENLPKTVGELPRVEQFEAGDVLALDGLRLTSFPITHDAADPVSYIIESEGVKLGMASDLGHVTNVVRARLAGSHGLLLEANYCPRRLETGPYPPALRQRIRSRHGHLSNQAMLTLLKELLHDRLRLVVLAHISKENNTPNDAWELAHSALTNHPAEICCALQDSPTPVFELVS